MKKTILLTGIVMAAFSAHSQSGQKWATSGNSNATGDFLGTTNNFPIDFKTNNVLRMSLGTTGVLKIGSLAGTGNRMLIADAGGNLVSLPAGKPTEMLTGNGTWTAVPWHGGGNNLYYTIPIGIGTSPDPAYALDVSGNTRFSGTVTSASGFMFDASNGIKASPMADGSTVIDVSGNTRVSGTVTSANGFMFDGSTGFRTSTTASGSTVIGYGRAPLSGVGVPVTLNPCVVPGDPLAPNTPQNIHQIGGMMQLFDDSGPMGSYNPTGSIMNFQSWPGCSSIDVQGGQPSGGLLINYFCGKNVSICSGVNGGTVYMGNKVAAAQSVKIGYDATINVDPNASLTIFQAGAGKKGLVFDTYDNSIPLISVRNPNFTQSPFTVMATGDVSNTGSISSASLSGMGTRTVLVDNTGKLILGTATTASTTNWATNGNAGTNPGTDYIGTSDGADLSVKAGNGLIAVKGATGNVGFGTNTPSSNYEFYRSNADCQVKISSKNSYPSKVPKLSLITDAVGVDMYVGTNATSPSPFVMDLNGKHFFAFNNGNMLLGDPDNLPGDAASGTDIYTKLTINAKTSGGANFWNGIPFKIINTDLTTTNKTIFKVGNDGKTCINCDNPGSFMLAVNGKIGAREIKVTMVDPWPDYVFEKDYQLPALKEVENYVNENKHLPGVPSEAELKKEEYSLDLAQMQNVQMKKIEEVYLYLIELQKQVDELKKENQQLKEKANH